MLQLISAGKRFGHKLLFEKVDWQITPGERTGLVGGNGTGKSTLLRILAGLDSLDDGTIERAGNMTVGYLPQDGLQLRGRSVFEECLSAFDATRALEQTIRELHGKVSELDPKSPEYLDVISQLSRAEAEFQARDGYTMEARVGIVLSGLGFSKSDWARNTEEFSGGWQMRIALAKLLLAQPQLLLLDEPTNHLDLEARNWLEDYLHSYPYAYVLISHDRFFLDVVTDKIVELWNKRLYGYTGNYEKYLQQKAERQAQLEAAYAHQREHIDHLEAFINRFRAQATKARQVQSRIKELERIERIELPPQENAIHFSFPQPPPSGRTVVQAQQVAKSYAAKQVFSEVDFTIERGERVALVGPNGAGKSTLIRLLSTIDIPTTGEIHLGHNVVLQYFAQDQYKELDAEARMLDDLGRSAPKIPQTELRSLLGCFLFSGDDVYKPLGVLSGGERNRYALARLLVSPANFLLLDEPTNHLDLRAKDVLLEALRGFTGTVVFVSHDRAFIDALATRVFEVRDGAVHVYTGNYEDYLWQTSRPTKPETRTPSGIVSATSNGNTHCSPQTPAILESSPTAKRINPIRLRQMQERCDALEEEIPRLEAAIQTAEQEMAIYVSAERYQSLDAQLRNLRADHEACMAEWESLMQQLEEQTALAP
ncbi:MAG TPA: ABC-F family ATP-binding cassette domain-containing protein [Acidobacteriaceae bacterium]|nr:ABC-F family ATP-binding cassette domain-containing protein [Acidobacteriaceae bacterium]